MGWIKPEQVEDAANKAKESVSSWYESTFGGEAPAIEKEIKKSKLVLSNLYKRGAPLLRIPMLFLTAADHRASLADAFRLCAFGACVCDGRRQLLGSSWALASVRLLATASAEGGDR